MSVDTGTNLIKIPSHFLTAAQGSGYLALANGAGEGGGDEMEAES